MVEPSGSWKVMARAVMVERVCISGGEEMLLACLDAEGLRMERAVGNDGAA